MTNLQIWQIYYDENSKNCLDPGFIPYDNTGKSTFFFENEVIIDIWRSQRKIWQKSNYVGVLSWRFKEKTNLTSEFVLNFVDEYPNKDVYSLSPVRMNQLPSHYSETGFNKVIDLCEIVDRHNVFPFKLAGYSPKYGKDFRCYCNFFICRPEIFDDYVENYLLKLYNWMRTCNDENLLDMLSRLIPHRNQLYTFHTFLMEGLFERYVAHKEYTFEYIQEEYKPAITKSNVFKRLQNISGIRKRAPKKPIHEGVNLIGFINGDFGLGESCRMIKQSLDSEKIPHVVNEVIADRHKLSDHYETTRIQKYQTNLIVINPDNISLLPKNYMTDKYNIGVWFWELETLPSLWKKIAIEFDEIWTASSFLFDVFKKQLPHTVIKMIKPPISIPPILDKNECKDMLGIGTNTFLCSFVFDCYSDCYRKNPVGVIEAFKKCFTDGQDCKLIIKSQNATDPELAMLIAAIDNDKRIQHISNFYSREEMNVLMNATDVYISLHRSEGFGLSLMEAILLGKPTVSTNYSGNTDFCKTEWCELVDFDMIDVDQKSRLYRIIMANEPARWADPITEDAAMKLKKIYDNLETYNEKAKIGMQWILDNYNTNSLVFV
jgi:glycosyltransferase involved in cell wall biosynthesis